MCCSRTPSLFISTRVSRSYVHVTLHHIIYGCGAVLSHLMLDSSERPIAYASRSLSAAEKNYSQLDKEGLSLIFGVTKFHQYLYGTQFTHVMDHRPLIGLFDE